MGKKNAGKKGAEKKGSLKKIIIFLAVTHPLEALMAARKAKKLGLNHRRWFLATLLFGVFASSRMKEPAAVEVEVAEAPKGKKAKKEKKSKKTKDTKIIIEVIEEPEEAGGKKAKKAKKNKKSK